MPLRLLTQIVLMSLMFFFINKAMATEVKFWKVLDEHATCLLAHSNEYLSRKEDVFLIVISACPIIDPTMALATLEENTELPRISVSENKDIDELIVYSRQDLLCLMEIEVKTNLEITFLPKNPCDIL